MKNPKCIIWDILANFNKYMDHKGSFCREFKCLQHFLTIYMIIIIHHRQAILRPNECASAVLSEITFL